MKRAVIYARVSSDNQAEEGQSVDSQIESCRRKVLELDAAVLGVYRDDGISGTTDARPGFRAAIEHCRVAEPDYLVVWSSSRFARNQRDAIVHKESLRGVGTRLVYASQGIDLWTDEGWLTDSVQQIFDEAYSRQVSKDTRRSMISAASEGYFMGGRVPFGYQTVPAADGRHKRLQPHPEESPVVQSMFAASARQVGAYAIATNLNGQGLTLRGKPWTKGAILHILKSEVYMGEVIFNRFDRKRERRRPKGEWVRVKGHDELVTPEQFDQVQRGLAERMPTEGRAPANSEHAFAGLMRCALCGSSLVIATGTGRAGKVYSYYACRGDLQGKKCTFKRLPAEAFDRWMMDELMRHVFTPENLRGVIAQLDTAAADWVKDRARRRSALVLELRGVEGRRAKLYDALETHGKDTPGISEMGPRLRELNDQVRRLELALVQIEDEPEPIVGQISVSADEAVAVMRKMVADCESPKALRAFVASIVKEIVVDLAELRVDYHPECLIREQGAMVHSTKNWLPVVGLLRTGRVLLAHPFKGRSMRRLAA